MDETEFTLALIEHAQAARRSLCGARKDVILANAQALMCKEDIACLQDLLDWARYAEKLCSVPPAVEGGE